MKNLSLLVFGLGVTWTAFSQGSWIQKASIPPSARNEATAFSIGNYGYIGTGFGGSFYADLWQFDPAANTWAPRSAFPGGGVDRSEIFVIGGAAYLCAGWNGSAQNFLYEYNQIADAWSVQTSLPASTRYNAIGMAIGNKGYVGAGYSNLNDFWEFTPSSVVVLETNKNIEPFLELFPNPAKDQCRILFDLPASSDCTLDIFDLQGKRIRNLETDLDFSAGLHEVQVSTADLPSGIYLVVLKTAASLRTCKLVVHR